MNRVNFRNAYAVLTSPQPRLHTGVGIIITIGLPQDLIPGV